MIPYSDYQKLFQRDKNSSFMNLIIPATNNEDEVIRMKKYSADMFELVGKETMK